MKKKLATLTILFATLSCFGGTEDNHTPVGVPVKTASSIANTNPAELIVTFESLTMKQYEELDQALAELQGVKLVGYCQKINCYYFNYDQSVFKSEQDAFDALTLKTRAYKPLMKQGTTISMVQNMCNN